MTAIPILIKASILLGAALGGTRVLRRAPAATRHALWSVTFLALLALPALDGSMPPLHVPVPGWVPGTVPDPAVPGLKAVAPSLVTLPSPGSTTPTPDAVDSGGSRRENMAASASMPSAAVPSIATVVRFVWLGGAAAAVGTLLLSLIRVRRLTRTATDITDPGWREAADAIRARLAIRRPARVLVSDAVRTPMAGGVWRPVIFLPTEAATWTADRRDVVLAHELSHIAGRDPIRHLAARLAVGCYWFHPLAWIAARHASLAREQACDEAVLSLGVRPSDYARVLLDLAETMAPPRAAAALPMVERSLLETRLMAILDHGVHRSRLRQSLVPAATAALLALTLASAQPAARNIDVRTPAPRPPAATVTVEPASSAPSAFSQRAAQSSSEMACWTGSRDASFSGFTNTDDNGTIIERVGTDGRSQIIQQRFGDLRVCMIATGETTGRSDSPTVWAGRAPRVVIETARGGSTVHLDVRRDGGAAQTTWRVNGAARPFDASAQAWRDAVLAVLDRAWEVSTLRGEASSLYGDISSLRGEESTLRGEISSLRGEVSTMRGEQSSVRGEESMLRGEISTIQGEMSSLQGQISSERGSISSLQASRYSLSSADRDRINAEIKSHEDEITRLERELRDYNEGAKVAAVEKQIRDLNAEGKVAAIEDQIRKFDEAGKVAAIEKLIRDLNVEGKTADIERRIQSLDVERRSRQIEDRLDEAVKKLQQALAAIR